MILTIEKCGKRFRTLRGRVEALREVTLEIGDGEFFVLLGPSGCGKSTLLNLVAGLERPTAGEIRFGETVVASPAQHIFLSPRQRNVAMVFQSYALYPHLDVFGNIAFPLQVAGEKEEVVRDAVATAAARLGLQELLERRPGELSGGQRQRVAIARALVRRPSVFLLDEPLSNLDAQLRAGTRTELKVLQQELGITTLYVTHDQTEAMTLGHRIALLKEGEIVQVGSPQELYDSPRTPFAATFIGSPPMNLLPATLEGEEREKGILLLGGLRLKVPRKNVISGREVLVGVRPEHLCLVSEETEGAMPGTVRMVEPLGREFLLQIATDAGDLQALAAENPPQRGENVRLYLDPRRLHFFPANSTFPSMRRKI
jgi:ABC-type sugar transport system ATPase subunit